MDDKQKVYIRVQKERNKEIDLIFEQLGYKDVDSCHIIKEYSRLYSYDPENVELIIYPHPNGEIVCTALTSFLGDLVVDNYRELHLPEQWMDGDVLTNTQFSDIFAVCKSACNTRDDAYHCYMYADFGCDDIDAKGGNILRSAYRLATPSEVERFHELLHKHGKDWDAKNKRLVDWKWKPKEKERYWCICPDGHLSGVTFDNDEFDNGSYNFGNCFRTREEAEIAAERVKKALKGGNA